MYKMQSYCLKFFLKKKQKTNIDPKISGSSNDRVMIEAKLLLSNLGIKTPLSKIPILHDILF